MNAKRSLLTLFSSSLLFACGGSESLTDEEYDDIAQTVAGLTFEEGGDAEAAGDAADLAIGNLPGRFRSDATGSFSGQRGQLDYTYDIECRTARGHVIDPCDVRTRTASIAVRIEGELDTPRRRATLLRTGSWSLSWDGQNQLLVDGITSTDLAGSFEALRRTDSRTYVVAADASFAGLELDLATRRFVDGRIEYALDAERTRTTRFREVEASFSVDVVVELTPNGPAVIEIAKSRTYTVDPATGTVEPAS